MAGYDHLGYGCEAGYTLQTAYRTSSVVTALSRQCLAYPYLRNLAGETLGLTGRAETDRMRRKLLLTVALAVLGTAITAGVVNAQSDQTTTTTSGPPPGGQNQPPVSSYPACSDLKDNDGDGLTDLSDPGCSGVDGHRRVGHGATSPTTPRPRSRRRRQRRWRRRHRERGRQRRQRQRRRIGRLHRRRRRSRAGRPGGSGGHGVPGGGANGSGGTSAGSGQQDTQVAHQPTRKPNGVPTKANPTLTVADFGPAPLGVPSFLIDQFSIPPFLLPIYQACGTQYGIPWEVLAGINRIETAFGTNLNVSTAGAVGWMQFIPSTWKAYGVDANGDGRKDPYNPVDAICAAARYLKAAGGDSDLRTAIFAYNHADWYVDEVLLYAGQYGKLPEDLVGSLTGLTQGDRFPVAANARYADDLSERDAAKRAKPSKGASGNVADVVSSSPTRRGINIYSHDGAPAVAVNDGTIKRIGHNAKLGNYVVLQDNYGNRFTYSQLGHLSKVYPVPKQHKLSGADFKIVSPKKDEAPSKPATRGKPLASQVGWQRVQRCRQEARQAGEDGVRERHVQHRQGAGEHRGPAAAALRPAGAPPQRRPRRDHGPARSSAVEEVPRLLDLQVLLRRRAPLQPQLDGAAAASQGLAGRRRHRARPAREDRQARAARELLHPARGTGRPEDRSEADPRRLEAARGDGDLPRRRQEPVLVHGRERDPGPADAEDPARAPGARRPAPVDLRVRSQRHPHRPDRPADPRGDGVPRRQRLPADHHLTQVRPQLPDHLRQRLQSTRPATRWTSRR